MFPFLPFACCDLTSQFTVWDVVPHQEIYAGRGYRALRKPLIGVQGIIVLGSHEICPVCKEIVQDAEIFPCICGGYGKSLHEHNSSPFVLTHSRERISYHKMFDFLGVASSPVRRYV